MWPRRLAVSLVSLLVSSSAIAQEATGALYGTVLDPAGKVLPGVSVGLQGLGESRTQLSDKLGKFRFKGLDPGRYDLSALLEGFGILEQPDISIRAGRSTTLELKMIGAVAEVITVTSESPLLDERKLSLGTVVDQVNLESIPTARDPWALLPQTPGVLLDRVNVGGNESGVQPSFSAPAVRRSQNDYLLDGMQITDMAWGGSSTFYDFDQFTQIEISTGGTDLSKATAGVSLNMVTKRGTNEFRGSARFFITDADGYFGILSQSEPNIDPNDLAPGQDEIVGDHTEQIQDIGFESGGPAWRDRVWLWGAWARTDIQSIDAGGMDNDTLMENTALKLNAQIATANSLVASWNHGNRLKWGRGAPEYTPEASWDNRAPNSIFRVEDSHVFGSNLFLTATWLNREGFFTFEGRGGSGPEAPEMLWDSDGIFKRNNDTLRVERPHEELKLNGSYFFSAGSSSHELAFGGRHREYQNKETGAFPGRQLVHVAGENFGLSQPVNILAAYRAGSSISTALYSSLWIQDTVSVGGWTLNAGLRYDLQRGRNEATSVPAHPVFPDLLPAVEFPGNDGGGFEWGTISPRVALTYAVGEERKTLLRASYSRFPEALRAYDISRVDPAGGAVYFYFFDANGNRMWDSEEIDGAPFLFGWDGIDPENPTALDSPNRNDPDLEPNLTDEIVLGTQHAFWPELVGSLGVTWRRTTNVHDELNLIRELDGTERVATREDFYLDQTVEGLLPNGESFATDFYALRPGLEFIGGDLLTNGVREIDYLGATASLTKRLSNQWMLRGFINYGESEWKIPESFFDFDDPTDDRKTWDNPGELFYNCGDWGEACMQSRWSFNVNGMYQLAPNRPWGLNVAGNVYGREGYPLPYFTRAAQSDGGGRSAIAVPSSDRFRTDDIFVVDLRLEKELATNGTLGLTFAIDGFNILNGGYVLRRNLLLNYARPAFVTETLSPRIFRLSVRLNWR